MMTIKVRFALPLVISMTGMIGCTASEADCEALGRHFVDLSIKEAEAEDDVATSIRIVAEEIANELVRSCKAEPRRKSELDCLLGAASLAELDDC